jgi:hypothetical protein
MTFLLTVMTLRKRQRILGCILEKYLFHAQEFNQVFCFCLILVDLLLTAVSSQFWRLKAQEQWLYLISHDLLILLMGDQASSTYTFEGTDHTHTIVFHSWPQKFGSFPQGRTHSFHDNNLKSLV